MPLISSFPSGTGSGGTSVSISAIDVEIPVASWSGSAAPYTHSVAVSGVTADNYVLITTKEDIDNDEYVAIARARIVGTAQNEDSISLAVLGEVPSITVHLRFIILNNEGGTE